jgi:hypothetical protein
MMGGTMTKKNFEIDRKASDPLLGKVHYPQGRFEIGD